MNEQINLTDSVQASVVARNGLVEDHAAPELTYTFEAYDRHGKLKWREEFKNLVTTVGKNDILDKYFQGSGYTAAWFLGLINSSGYSAVAAGDTAASHAGWTETSAYTAATRPAVSWAAAAAGSKSASAAVSFTINATVTIKGAFLISNDTKGGTTGVLYSCGAFAADRALVNTDILNVNVTVNG